MYIFIQYKRLDCPKGTGLTGRFGHFAMQNTYKFSHPKNLSSSKGKCLKTSIIFLKGISLTCISFT